MVFGINIIDFYPCQCIIYNTGFFEGVPQDVEDNIGTSQYLELFIAFSAYYGLIVILDEDIGIIKYL